VLLAEMMVRGGQDADEPGDRGDRRFGTTKVERPRHVSGARNPARKAGLDL
jgi:hypothetical protein